MGLMDFVKDSLDPAGLFHDDKKTRDSKSAADRQYEQTEFWNDKNYNEQIRQFNENLQFQQHAYQYQKDLNAMQMEREDNAVQRRVADLKAAGLSPTLAAGSAASATPVHAGTAPQGDVAQRQLPSDVKVQNAMFRAQMQKERLQLASMLMGNFTDISRTAAESTLNRAKAAESQSLKDYYDALTKGVEWDNYYKAGSADSRIESWNLDNQRKVIENNVQASIAPMRVTEMSNKLRQDDIDYMNSILDSQLKYDSHLASQAALVEQKIKNKYAEEHQKLDISEKKLKAISMAVAIEQASVDLEETKRVNKLYIDHFGDLPPNIADKVMGSTAGSAAYIFGTGTMHIVHRICQGIGYVATHSKAPSLIKK